MVGRKDLKGNTAPSGLEDNSTVATALEDNSIHTMHAMYLPQSNTKLLNILSFQLNQTDLNYIKLKSIDLKCTRLLVAKPIGFTGFVGVLFCFHSLKLQVQGLSCQEDNLTKFVSGAHLRYIQLGSVTTAGGVAARCICRNVGLASRAA